MLLLLKLMLRSSDENFSKELTNIALKELKTIRNSSNYLFVKNGVDGGGGGVS